MKFIIEIQKTYSNPLHCFSNYYPFEDAIFEIINRVLLIKNYSPLITIWKKLSNFFFKKLFREGIFKTKFLFINYLIIKREDVAIKNAIMYLFQILIEVDIVIYIIMELQLQIRNMKIEIINI